MVGGAVGRGGRRECTHTHKGRQPRRKGFGEGWGFRQGRGIKQLMYRRGYNLSEKQMEA